MTIDLTYSVYVHLYHFMSFHRTHNKERSGKFESKEEMTSLPLWETSSVVQSTSYQWISLTGLHVRRDLKLGTVPSVFPRTKVNEESLCREKETENFQNDSVVVSLPTLEKWVEELKMENKRLLHDELH